MNGIRITTFAVALMAATAHADTREELKNGMAEVDSRISGMTCGDLKKEVPRLPEIIEEVGTKPEGTVEGKLERYALGILLQKIAWCIPNGKKPKSLGFRKPRKESPNESALIEWHSAVVSGDYETFRKLSGDAMDSFPDNQVEAAFRELRLATPREITIGEPKTNAYGATFEAVGCVGIKPVVGSLIVMQKDGGYIVTGAWGPSWNPNIQELHPCF